MSSVLPETELRRLAVREDLPQVAISGVLAQVDLRLNVTSFITYDQRQADACQR